MNVYIIFMAFKRRNLGRRGRKRVKKRMVRGRGKQTGSVHSLGRTKGQVVVFRPRLFQEFFPDRFITTHTYETRINVALGSLSTLSGTAQYFNIQGSQIYRPMLASTASNFQPTVSAIPAITFNGDFTSTNNFTGYGQLAGIYDGYIPLQSSIEIVVDNYTVSSDQMQIYCMPLQQTKNGSLLYSNPTSEQVVAQQKLCKRGAWDNYINVTKSKLRNSFKHSELLGYSSDVAYTNDGVNTFSTTNVNLRPQNEIVWYIGYASNQSSAMAGVTQMTIRVRNRVCWQGISTPVGL